MSKMHYFSNKFSKFAKRWGFPPPAPLNLQYWWLEVPWFGQIVVLKMIMTKSNFKIFMTSFQWRHRNYVTKKHFYQN